MLLCVHVMIEIEYMGEWLIAGVEGTIDHIAFNITKILSDMNILYKILKIKGFMIIVLSNMWS